ncbi:MAG: flagellar hook-associated protein FlgL [Gammaproteobacteria bacterium]|nr:flagellar hook-associated protein FlgL [Gammaproteobacteria bacterium]
MRISSSQMQLQGLNSLLKQQARLVDSQMKLSTGKKMNTPADDPVGSAAVLNITQQLKIIAQYQENAETAKERQQLEETVLISVENVIRRAKVLAIQGANSPVGSGGRSDIALEIRQRLSELADLANTTDANGEYIFAGFQGHTKPFTANLDGTYTYNGDQGQRLLQISADRQVADRDPGSDIFQFIKDGNGTFSVIDNANNTGNGIIHTGSVSDITAIDGDTYTLIFGEDTTATTANVGAFSFADGAPTNNTLVYTLDINGTTVYSVDDTGAPPPVLTLQGLADEINNDAGTTGVRAHVNGGQLFLANDSPSTGDIVITEGFSGFTATEGDTVLGYFGNTLTDTNTSVVTTLNNTAASNYIVLDSSNNIETTGTYVPEGAITFNGITTSVKEDPNNGDRFTISPSTNRDIFRTLNDLAKALEAGGGTTSETNTFNTINRMLLELDNVENNILTIRAGVGGRLNTIDDQKNFNEDFSINLESNRSRLEDLNYTSAITEFEQIMTALQAAQASFARIQGLSLFNYL